MLEVRLTARRGTFELDVDFKVPTPGIVALFGRSGCGKSTLVNSIAGLLRPTRGRIAVDGAVLFDDVSGVDIPAQRRRIGYVFQNPRLFPHLRVLANLEYGLKRAGRGTSRTTTDAVVELLGLRSLLDRRPRNLSGGEQQRVALGRALLSQPQLLLLDEPLASLDLARREDVLPYLERLRDALRIPMVYVSHQFDEILRLADHVVLMDEGRVTSQGDVVSLSLEPALAKVLGSDAAGAVVETRVHSVDEAAGVAHITVGEGSLQVDADGLAVGRKVRVQLLARDLILATELPRGLSVRNMVSGSVDRIVAEGSHTKLVYVNSGGVPLLARITASAATELRLSPGNRVWVLVKSMTLRGRVFAAPEAEKSR